MKDVNSMTLQEKIGQMILCGFEGTEVTKELEALSLDCLQRTS
jgi:beta-N-acetylhexosaminidase